MKLDRQQLYRIAAFIFVVGLSIFIVLIPGEKLEAYESLGYPGIFIIALISNATVILPAPAMLIVGAMGAKFSPFLVGLFAGLGSGLGELSGYLAGFSGQAFVEKSDFYKRSVNWLERNGALTIFLLALIPNPIFDITGIAAGTLKMPVWKFLLWCTLGKTVKMILTAYFGDAINIPGVNNVQP